MRICPKCRSEVELDFDVCWNCQYSFSEDRIINPDHLRMICPKCNFENESSAYICLNCGTSLPENENHNLFLSEKKKDIDCLRCKVPLQFQGNFKFHEGSRVGIFGNLFELFINRESFDLYFCPQCGKIEFYLPNF